jgi:hypothetical protein
VEPARYFIWVATFKLDFYAKGLRTIADDIVGQIPAAQWRFRNFSQQRVHFRVNYQASSGRSGPGLSASCQFGFPALKVGSGLGQQAPPSSCAGWRVGLG